MKTIIDKATADAVLSAALDRKLASIFQGSTQRPFQIQKVVISLTTERLETNPYVIGFAFKSFYVQDATDSSTTINFKPTSRDTVQSSFAIKKNDVWTSDLPIPGAFLHWDAQSGESITIVFFTDAEFKSGSQISVNSGGVSINEGSSFDAQTRITLSAATAAAIIPANADRKVCTLENATGADLYVGNSSVVASGADRGIKIPAGGILYWRNTGALYGYSVAGGDVHYLDQE